MREIKTLSIIAILAAVVSLSAVAVTMDSVTALHENNTGVGNITVGTNMTNATIGGNVSSAGNMTNTSTPITNSS